MHWISRISAGASQRAMLRSRLLCTSHAKAAQNLVRLRGSTQRAVREPSEVLPLPILHAKRNMPASERDTRVNSK